MMIIIATILLAVGGACFLVRVIGGPSLADRIVALDGLVVTIVAAIVLNSIRLEVEWFLDVAIFVAFIAFVGAIAGSRFIERRGG